MIDTDTNSENLGFKSIHFAEQVLNSGSNPDLICANLVERACSYLVRVLHSFHLWRHQKIDWPNENRSLANPF